MWALLHGVNRYPAPGGMRGETTDVLFLDIRMDGHTYRRTHTLLITPLRLRALNTEVKPLSMEAVNIYHAVVTIIMHYKQ